MPIKLHRTQVFREGTSQGQVLLLNDHCHKLLRKLDCIVCDKNYGRCQPDSPFQEIDDWYNDGRYWSDAYDTRWNVAVTLYYLATHPDAQDFGNLLADSLDYRDDWHDWSDVKRNAVAETVFQLWKWLLHQKTDQPEFGYSTHSWDQAFAGRIFEFAKTMDLIDARYFGELFQDDTCPNRFLYDCLFVREYWQRFRDPDDPWMQHLPTLKEVRNHLQWGFFKFPEHEEVASSAEQSVAWNTDYCELLDD